MGKFDKGGRFGGRGFGGGNAEGSIMHKATCSDCGRACEVPFKPMHGKPVYCNDCFKRDEDPGAGRSNRFGGRRDGGRDFGRSNFRDRDRQMHEATCSECGKRCEVPFKPTGEKPVYCSDCFGASKGEGSGSKKPDQSKAQLDQVNVKLDKILKILETLRPKSEPVMVKTDKVSKNEPVSEKTEKDPENEFVIGKQKKSAKAEKPKKEKKKAKK